MKMKLLIVRGYGSIMNIGNYNTQEIGLAKSFIKKGIDTDIVFYGGNEKTHIQEWPVEEGKHIKIYWMKGKAYLKHGVMPEVYALAKKYDYLWLDEYNQYTSHKLAKLYPEKTYIYHGPYDQNYSIIRMIMDKICSTLFFDSNVAQEVQVFAKSQLAKKSLIKRGFQKVETIGVGLDASRFLNTTSVDVNNIGLNESDKVFLYIGSIDDRRNTLFLIEVFNKIYKRNTDCKLLLIGKAKDRYWKKCMERIRSYKLESCIVHIDKMPQEQLPTIYKRAAAFMFPTKYDIFGMVLMEAMFFSLPVITSNNGGAGTLIKTGENGIICDLKTEDWVYAANQLLLDQERGKRLGINAHETIVNNFSWDSITEHAMMFMKGL